MHDAKVAPYGSWKSPITTDLIVAGSVGLTQPQIDGDSVYWIEKRPREAGRNVIVKCNSDKSVRDVIPPPFNARTRVHEYGGGDYTVRDGAIYFSNFSDQRLYVIKEGASPAAISPAGDVRYAESVIDFPRGRLICVREDHTTERKEAINTLATLKREGNDDYGTVLVEGADFYSSPRLSPDGMRLAWLTWNHPNMPWDQSQLWIGTFADDGLLATTELVAGYKGESIFQPEWSPDGVLYFVSDRNGWWNLYRLNQAGSIEQVCDMQAEFGMPQWGFGMST